jgi:AcrR family transcriptional regulator
VWGGPRDPALYLAGEAGTSAALLESGKNATADSRPSSDINGFGPRIKQARPRKNAKGDTHLSLNGVSFLTESMGETAAETRSRSDVSEFTEASPVRRAVAKQHFGYKQQRSQETFERLLDAAERLIAEGQSFEDVSVAGVCERAGLSVGAFYRRFESKEGLLDCLHDRYTERLFEGQSRSLAPARWEGIGLAAMLERLVEEAFSSTRRDAALIRASEIRAQTDAGFALRERRLHAEYLALFTRLIMQRVESIGHPSPRTAAEFCAYQLRAVLYYFFVTSAFLAPADSSPTALQLSATDERDAARELTSALIAYLQIRASVED